MDINAILTGEAIDASARAVDAWKRINDKPSSITIKQEDGTTLAAQTVRIEWSNSNSGSGQEMDSAVGIAGKRGLIVFGVRDHPTVADTQIERGDRFNLNGVIYEVIDIITTLGEVQAQARVMS